MWKQYSYLCELDLRELIFKDLKLTVMMIIDIYIIFRLYLIN
jgi:hypothetical protein